MDRFKKILKMIGLVVAGVIVVVVLSVMLFMYTSPQFGASPSQEKKEAYAKSGHYENGDFQNEIPTSMSANIFSIMWDYWNKVPNTKPKSNIETDKIDSATVADLDSKITQLTWFGHSTFLLNLDGKKILIDPMLGDYPSPHPMVGAKRYSKELPLTIEQLPSIDAVLLSHDHFDHLDYGSIMKLKDKVSAFYVPLGLDAHLLSWGVDSTKIHVFDWWDSASIDGISLVCAPARHFSGRGLTDRYATLWCSWIIKGEKDNIYFSGDSGYGPHFKLIGEKYGPFDIALMECGQYNEKWESIHMMPEQTVEASVELGAKLMMPIHWGAFTLALHSWTDPAERVTSAASEKGVLITTPRIGEPVILGEDHPISRWWE